MQIEFKLCKHGTCGVSITGLETEIETNYSEFKYSESVSVNIMIPLDSKEKEGKYEYTVNEHTENDILDQTIMQFPKDGLYKIIHLILPNKNWAQNKTNAYYYDSGKFYRITKSITENISVEDLIKYNSNLETASMVFYGQQLTFSSCQLQECYYKYANNFLENYCSSGKCYTKSSTEFDIIYIGMHVMKYLLDLNRLYEALYVLEKLTGCTGVCYQNDKINIKGNGCGC